MPRNKSGTLYYYEKRRVGSQVISEYFGGPVVDLAQKRAEMKRERKQAGREGQRLQRMSTAEIDKQKVSVIPRAASVTSYTLRPFALGRGPR